MNRFVNTPEAMIGDDNQRCLITNQLMYPSDHVVEYLEDSLQFRT